MTFKELNIGKIGIFGFALFAPISIAFSQMCMGIAILGWIIKMVGEKSFRWKKTPLDIPILIYVIAQIIAVLNSQNIGIGFGAWINTDWFILFYYAVVNVVDEEDDYKWLIILLAISGTISAVYGILQHFIGFDIIRGDTNLWPFGDFFRATGFFSLPLTYGGVQLSIFLLLAPFYFLKQEILKKKVFSIVLLLLLFSIIASYARSAWMGFGAATVLLLFFLNKKYVFIVIGTTIAGVVAVYFIHPDLLFNQGLLSMFDISENAPYNNLVRMKLWQSSWTMIKDNWLFGIGYSNFAEIFETYKVPFDYKGMNDPHNDILKVMSLSGVIGGLAFILLWIIDLWKKLIHNLPGFLENINIWKAGAVGSFFAIFALLIAGITQEYYHDAETAELWWFIAALGMICVINKGRTKKNDI